MVETLLDTTGRQRNTDALRVISAEILTRETPASVEPPTLFGRAIDFMEGNAHRDISLTDIAEVVYITPRALQYMFRKHRDCTPTEYLRLVRLRHVHTELVAGARATTTVGEIVKSRGFAHLGRFAVYYRERYGRSPHDTLRG